MLVDFFARLANASTDEERTWLVTQMTLDSLPPDVRQAVFAAAIPRWFEANVLAAMLTVDSPQADRLYAELQRLPFVEVFAERGHNIHDSTRKLLCQHLKEQDWPRYQTYSQLASNYFTALTPNTLENQIEANALALQANPDKVAELLNKKGYLLYISQNYVECLAALQEIIVLDPQDTKAYSNIGVVLYDMGRKAEALAAYERAITLDPQDAKAYSNMGVVLYDMGRKAEALAAYERAITLDPQDAKAYSNMGVVLYDMGLKAEALAAYERAIALDSQDAKVHYNVGVVLYAMRRKAEALAAYERAIALDPQDEKIYYNMGVVLYAMGHKAEALAAYERAIALNPHDAKAYYNTGVVLSELENRVGALAAYERAIALDPKYIQTDVNNEWNSVDALGCKAEAFITYELVRAYSNVMNAPSALGRKAKIPGAYEKAIALDPKYIQTDSNIGKLQNQNLLFKILIVNFTKTELETLIFNLGIDLEELPHDTKSQLIHNLIMHCFHRGRTSDLESAINKELAHRNNRMFEFRGSGDSKQQARFSIAFATAITTFILGVLTNVSSASIQQKLGENLTPSLLFQLVMLSLACALLSSVLQVLPEQSWVRSIVSQSRKKNKKNAPSLSIELIRIKLMGAFGYLKNKNVSNTALWVITILSTFCFFAYYFANVDILYESSPLKFIFVCWVCLTLIPLEVVFYSSDIERRFQTEQAKVASKSSKGLFFEKLFSAYITAILGEAAFLILLLISDVYLNIWEIFGFGIKFVFWFIAQFITAIFCLVGVSSANKYWMNRLNNLQENLSSDRITLILALSFPFFLIPFLGIAIAIFIVPYLKDPIVGPVILIASALSLYNSIQKYAVNELKTGDKVI